MEFFVLEKAMDLSDGLWLSGRMIARTGSSIVKDELEESRVLDNIQMVSRECLGRMARVDPARPWEEW